MNMAAKVTMARSFSFHIHISLVVRIFRFHRKDRGSIPLYGTLTVHLPEWSKGSRLGRDVFVREGSNPSVNI